jgi:hypothetical protein
LSVLYSLPLSEAADLSRRRDAGASMGDYLVLYCFLGSYVTRYGVVADEETDHCGPSVTLGVVGGLTLFKMNFEEQYLESMTFVGNVATSVEH